MRWITAGYGCKRFLSQNDMVQILDLIEPEVSHWRGDSFSSSFPMVTSNPFSQMATPTSQRTT